MAMTISDALSKSFLRPRNSLKFGAIIKGENSRIYGQIKHKLIWMLLNRKPTLADFPSGQNTRKTWWGLRPYLCTPISGRNFSFFHVAYHLLSLMVASSLLFWDIEITALIYHLKPLLISYPIEHVVHFLVAGLFDVFCTVMTSLHSVIA